MLRRLAPLLLVTLAAPAGAADFALPDGCAAFLTVQSKGCSVTVLWRCDVSTDGSFTEASFGPDGLETLVSYSANYQWLDSVYTWDSSREAFLPPAADPIDLAALLETGIDTYDFTMRRTEPGASYDVRVTGADALTGRTTKIDGYTFEIVDTRLEITGENGAVEYKADGQQYFSRELGHFFLGPETVFATDGSATDYDSAPIDIIRPGEPGFASSTPLYECAAADAAFATPRLTAPEHFSAQETDHDQI